LLVPLRQDGKVLGALALQARRKRGWPDTLVARLEFVTAILSYGLTSVERKAEPKQRASEDREHENELAKFAGVRTLGGFALSLAHELNQPLTAILSNAQAARRFLAAPDPQIDEVRAIIDDIDADDRRAGELIHGMRALLNHHEVEMALFDLNEIVREVVRLLHGDFLIRRVSLVLDLEAPLPAVRCDRVQVQQVLMNLLMNGFEAMQNTATLDRRMIIRTRAGTDGSCVISIRDAGSGIAPAGLGRVFEQFFSTKPDGLGMGLSIARSLVESHGGRIWATNNSDVGSTFHVALPIAPSKEAA
jgi:two-component system, LuxR family, sensor kinase FixL